MPLSGRSSRIAVGRCGLTLAVALSSARDLRVVKIGLVCCNRFALPPGPDPPAVTFFYSPDRSAKHPEQHLASYAGLMQADAYAGFNRLYSASRKPGPITEVACWSHARHNFFDLVRLAKAPIAIEAVKRIDELFAIEPRSTACRHKSDFVCAMNAVAAHGRARGLDARERTKLSGQSNVSKAIAYCLTRWAALTRFLDDGRLCLRQAGERRGTMAVGRHNWTFAGSDEGGRRAAAIYTLIHSARINDVDPHAWLADVLARLQDHPAKRIDELLPWNWKRERLQKAAA